MNLIYGKHFVGEQSAIKQFLFVSIQEVGSVNNDWLEAN